MGGRAVCVDGRGYGGCMYVQSMACVAMVHMEREGCTGDRVPRLVDSSVGIK